MKNFCYGLLLILMATCSNKEAAVESSEYFFPGERITELKNKHLGEVSGIVASVKNTSMFWAHNDSGNDPEIYLVDEKLNIKLTCRLTGVENRDWEDIAIGPGPDVTKTYLYIGDIGDNEAIYPYKYIYRFEEPTFSVTGEETINISSFERITFRLDDETKDTETLLLDPLNKNLYVISKREHPVYLYELKFPQSSHDTLTATKVMSLPFSKIVGGDFSADGKEILLKNYTHIYYWKNPSGKPIAEALIDAPVGVPYEVEPQGESITWSRDGKGFYTLSELNKNKKSYLYFYKRR